MWSESFSFFKIKVPSSSYHYNDCTVHWIIHLIMQRLYKIPVIITKREENVKVNLNCKISL